SDTGPRSSGRLVSGTGSGLVDMSGQPIPQMLVSPQVEVPDLSHKCRALDFPVVLQPLDREVSEQLGQVVHVIGFGGAAGTVTFPAFDANRHQGRPYQVHNDFSDLGRTVHHCYLTGN